VICLHCWSWQKVVKSHKVFGMYSSGNLPVLVGTITAIMPCLSQVRNVGWRGGFSCPVAKTSELCVCIFCTSIVLRRTDCFALFNILHGVIEWYELHIDHRGGRNSEDGEGDGCEPKALESFLKVEAAFETVKSLFYTHNIGEHDEQNILNLEFALFYLILMFQLNNRQLQIRV
jgi:hypothetical protein